MATRKRKAVGGAGQVSSPAGSPREAETAPPVPGSPRLTVRGEMVVSAARDGGSSVRERLLRATVDVVSVVGYDAMTVDRVAVAAGLGRGAFYRHLGGRPQALVGACDLTLGAWRAAVRSALDAACDLGPQQRVVAGLVALTRALAADPPGTAVFFLVGPVAGTAYQSLRGDLLALIATVLADLDAHTAEDGQRAAVGTLWTPNVRAGAVHELLHRHVARGRAAELPALVPALVPILARLTS